MTDISRWRSLETSFPRDGEIVDLWCIGEPDDVAFYCRDMFGNRCGRVTECRYQDGAWRPYMGLTRGMALPLKATHWMPLPNPPGEEQP